MALERAPAAADQRLAEAGHRLRAALLDEPAARHLVELLDRSAPGTVLEVIVQGDGPALRLPYELLRLPDGRLLATMPGVRIRRRLAGHGPTSPSSNGLTNAWPWPCSWPAIAAACSRPSLHAAVDLARDVGPPNVGAGAPGAGRRGAAARTVAFVTAMTDEKIRALRMRTQRLAGGGARRVPDVLSAVGALQAQDTRAAKLAVRCRSQGLDAEAVTHACSHERSVVRTWLMRGTLHMVSAEDVGWMVALLGPRFAAAGRRRRLELGLDDETCARALPAIRDSLSGHGPLSRSELVGEVRSRGIPVDPAGQAAAHLVAYAAMRGLTCRGPERENDEPTYVLVEEWVGTHPDREPEAALAELARRYLTGHGPATAGDFAYWAGIGSELARQGFQRIASQLAEVEVAGETAWMLASETLPDDTPPRVRLLPAFDAYLLGYRDRSPAVLVDGLVIGTWRLQQRGQRLTVRVEPFEELPDTARPGLEAEVADVGRFLHRNAALVIAGPSRGVRGL